MYFCFVCVYVCMHSYIQTNQWSKPNNLLQKDQEYQDTESKEFKLKIEQLSESSKVATCFEIVKCNKYIYVLMKL